MKIAIGSDHGGVLQKQKVIDHLIKKGYEVIDCGTYQASSCNYPEFGLSAARKIKHGEAEKGILICSSGEGISMAANKVLGIRCGIGYCDEVSHLMVEHNNANMIAFGAKFMSDEDVIRRVDIFLNASFEYGRHKLRVDMIEEYEKTHIK